MKNILLYLLFFLNIYNLNAQLVPVYSNHLNLKLNNSSQFTMNAMVQDDHGNNYVVGQFSDSIDFDGSGPAAMNVAVGGKDLFIASYTPSGSLRWALPFGNAGVDALCRMKYDPISGAVLVAGYYGYLGAGQPSFDFDPGPDSTYLIPTTTTGYIASYDTLGNFNWVSHLPPTSIGGINNSEGGDFTIDRWGNIYFVGVIGVGLGTQNIDMDPDSGSYFFTTLNSDFAIVKFSPNYEFIWAKQLITTNGGGTGNAITTDSIGNVFISGYVSTGNAVDYDPDSTNTYTLVGSSYNDPFLAKYDSAGNFMAAIKFGSGITKKLITLYNQKIVIASNFTGTISYAVNPGGSHSSAGNFDFAYGVFDNNLNYVYSKSGGASKDDEIFDIYADNHNDIYIQGYFQDSVALDQANASNKHYTPSYPYCASPFIAKYKNAVLYDWSLAFKDSALFGWNNFNLLTANENFGISVFGSVGSLPFDLDASATNHITNADSGKIMLVHYKETPENFVYPGDTDSSGVVDNYDLLSIGLYNGDFGYARNTVSNTWLPQVSPSWELPLQTNSINKSHVDCNGDGFVNADDTMAVGLNFGNVRSSKNAQHASLVDPNLYWNILNATANAGDTIYAELLAGTSTLPVNNLYGLGVQFNIPSSVISPNSMSFDFNGNWLGNATNEYSISRANANGDVKASIVKNDHLSSNGYGKVGLLKFRINPIISSIQNLNLALLNYLAIDANGNEIIFNIINDTISINSSVGIPKNMGINLIISPNPIKDNFNIAGLLPSESYIVKITDMLGKTVISNIVSNHQSEINLNIAQFNSGVYLLEINNNNTRFNQRIFKE